MKTKNLQTNLLKQNCYIRDCVDPFDLRTNVSDQFYESINEIVEKDCLKHERVLVPYEITPEYVNSFADSADFRRDPVSAIVNAPKRQGLGDIRDFQCVASMDDTQARDLFNQLRERFQQSASAPVSAPASAPASAPVSAPAPKSE